MSKETGAFPVTVLVQYMSLCARSIVAVPIKMSGQNKHVENEMSQQYCSLKQADYHVEILPLYI